MSNYETWREQPFGDFARNSSRPDLWMTNGEVEEGRNEENARMLRKLQTTGPLLVGSEVRTQPIESDQMTNKTTEAITASSDSSHVNSIVNKFKKLITHDRHSLAA